MIEKYIYKTIKRVINPRLLNSERGYQGEFQRELANILYSNGIFSNDILVEEEYQKRLGDHGIRYRPDLIIHIPIESSNVVDRRLNNFCTLQFKLKSDKDDANDDFNKIEQMFHHLDYREGYFINIQGYPNSFLKSFESNYSSRINEISFFIGKGTAYIRHDYFENGIFKTRAMCLPL